LSHPLGDLEVTYALHLYYYYYYTGEDYSDTVTSNAAGALYKIKLNT